MPEINEGVFWIGKVVSIPSMTLVAIRVPHEEENELLFFDAIEDDKLKTSRHVDRFVRGKLTHKESFKAVNITCSVCDNKVINDGKNTLVFTKEHEEGGPCGDFVFTDIFCEPTWVPPKGKEKMSMAFRGDLSIFENRGERSRTLKDEQHIKQLGQLLKKDPDTTIIETG